MLNAVKGIVRGNTIVVENENLQAYNGYSAIVTFLDKPQTKNNKKNLSKIVDELVGSIPNDSLTLDEYRTERLKKYEVIN